MTAYCMINIRFNIFYEEKSEFILKIDIEMSSTFY